MRLSCWQGSRSLRGWTLEIQEEITIRQMHESDFDEVMVLQSLCYFDGLPESRESLLAKFVASPSTCFVATQHGRLAAYLFAVPWNVTCPPDLNSQYCDLPDVLDCMYLHDLAIAPFARGHHLGSRMFEHLLTHLPRYGFNQLCLVAVQGSAGFWMNHGFTKAKGNASLGRKLETYGDNAVFMVRTKI